MDDKQGKVRITLECKVCGHIEIYEDFNSALSSLEVSPGGDDDSDWIVFKCAGNNYKCPAKEVVWP